MPERSKNTDISTRAMVLALKAGTGMITAQVAIITGLSVRQVNRIYSRAIERGFDPDVRPLTICDDWLCDAPRSGRPRTQTEVLKDELITKVSRDRYAQEKSCAELAAKEKKEAEEAIKELNKDLEPLAREKWELENGMRRLALRQLPGKQPTWRWNQKTGKLGRNAKKGGIDWFRYQKHIIIPQLIPFAKECEALRPGMLVQEDNAPAHAHQHQQAIYDLHDIKRLLWCPNSPDLNMIEPAWWYLKRVTTKLGAPKNRTEAIRVWKEAKLSQERIRAWIERIIQHIKEVIRLEGGNEYKEGRGENSIN
ncbi:hypothetical protein S40285_07808 [Stachybotrys chlorohalonatus IBT 40285]|uniref:Tc1-like transposase DDE domain-containing protein n=1 Tax=Stachybotrys chlorohalonatus (strain IBT 40285) TaxID=1283841 RepID=A0A084R2F6_STAC4|nr:hypothetical protein S40285_07808 [Stachybotrys chlorohalonata IBT 40285]